MSNAYQNRIALMAAILYNRVVAAERGASIARETAVTLAIELNKIVEARITEENENV